MKTMRDRKLGPGVLVRVLFGIGVLLVWIAPIPPLKVNSLGLTAPVVPQKLFVNNPVIATDDLLARPLFSQSRRPPPPILPVAKAPFKAPSEPVPSTDGILLLGVLQTRDRAVALVVFPNASPPRQVVPGSTLGQWVVSKISGDRVYLRSGRTNAEVSLPKPSEAGPSPTGLSMPASPLAFPPFLRTP